MATSDSEPNPSRLPRPTPVQFLPSVQFKLADSYPTPKTPGSLAIDDLIQAGTAVHAPASSFRAEAVYDAASRLAFEKVVERAREMDPHYQPPKLENVMRISTPDVATARALAAGLAANTKDIDYAVVQRIGPLPGVTPANDSLSVMQTHLEKPQQGVNARGAWDLGADGDGTRIVDIERGFGDHVDVPDPVMVHGNHADRSGRSPFHGTAVLGLVVGKDNDKGGIGVAPKAWIGFGIRYGAADTDDQIGAAIIDALTYLQYGDILLIDDQTVDDVGNPVPIETHPDVKLQLPTIDALGVILVQPSGTGTLDIDSMCLPASSAVIVGAISNDNLDAVGVKANHGTRVDCHALFGHIVTSGWDGDLQGIFPEAGAYLSDTSYTKSFEGSSGTSAIVAGVASLIQSYMATFRGCRLSPGALRDLLRTQGVASLGTNDEMGIMPDAALCIDKAAGPSPFLIRAHNSDNGDVPRRPWGGCPDILLLVNPLLHAPLFPSPKGSWAPSGAADAPANAYAYVRARSLGGNVVGTHAEVYVAPPLFLPPSNSWRHVGTAYFGELLADQSVRTSLAPLRLPTRLIMDWGGASLIAVLGSDKREAPSPHGIRDGQELERFLAHNEFVGMLTLLAPRLRVQPDWAHEQVFDVNVRLPSRPTGPVRLVFDHTFVDPVTVELRLPIANIPDVTGLQPPVLFTTVPVPNGETIEVAIGEGETARCRLSVRATSGTLPRGGFHIVQLNGDVPYAEMGGRIVPWW